MHAQHIQSRGAAIIWPSVQSPGNATQLTRRTACLQIDVSASGEAADDSVWLDAAANNTSLEASGGLTAQILSEIVLPQPRALPAARKPERRATWASGVHATVSRVTETRKAVMPYDGTLDVWVLMALLAMNASVVAYGLLDAHQQGVLFSMAGSEESNLRLIAVVFAMYELVPGLLFLWCAPRQTLSTRCLTAGSLNLHLRTRHCRLGRCLISGST